MSLLFQLGFYNILFCPGDLIFLNFLLGFLSLDFQCFTGSSELVEISVSILSHLLFGCAFVRTIFREQLPLASAFEAPWSCLALALRFFLDGVMVRTCCPSISKFRLGFSLPSFEPAGACFGDILELSLLSMLCLFSVFFVSLGCGYACRALDWIIYGRFSFLPIRLYLSDLSVVGSSQSLLSCALL